MFLTLSEHAIDCVLLDYHNCLPAFTESLSQEQALSSQSTDNHMILQESQTKQLEPLMKDNCQSLCGRVDSQRRCKEPCHLEFPAY